MITTEQFVKKVLLKFGRVCPTCKTELQLLFNDAGDMVVMCMHKDCQHAEVISWDSLSPKTQKTLTSIL
jgi:hypothetical protein